MMGELVSRCFHARTAAHILHLKTRSYATHKALGDFYDAIVGLADTLAETYQGAYGLIENYPARYKNPDDGVSMLEELRAWIESHRYECCDESDTCIQNIIDEIVALTNSTLYKLRFLK